MHSIQGSEKEHLWPGSVTAEFGDAHAGDDRVWTNGTEQWAGFQANCPQLAMIERCYLLVKSR